MAISFRLLVGFSERQTGLTLNEATVIELPPYAKDNLFFIVI